MLKLENVRKEFGDLVAVDDLSFEVKPGEILGLLGANGAGKSTTFRAIMNINPQTKGTITYKGKKVDLSLGNEIGFMCEQRALITKYTVERQLQFFAELKGMKKDEANRKITEWLEHFGMTDVRKKVIKELSKGNQQKIQLISAIIHEPSLIILDEPFSGLDPFNIKLFKDVILRLKDQGSAIIFSSHRLDHVEYFCENIIVLVNGKDLMRGKISDLKRESSISKVVLETTCPIEEIQALEYVTNTENSGEYINVFLNNTDSVDKLFDVIKNYQCTHFALELPTLEEVFLERVGEKYES